MKKEIELTIPTDWADVPLRKYIALTDEMENYKDDEEASTAVIIWHLCNLDPSNLKGISVADYAMLKGELSTFMNKIEFDLQRIITIDGIEYGFEPNLSNMAYGAYADITQYKDIKIDANWPKIMNILYRPVTDKKGTMYSIKPYDGNTDYKKWLDVGMDVNFGALFFFVNLSTDLVKSIPKSLKEMELPPSIISILEKSGEAIQQYTNSHKEIS